MSASEIVLPITDPETEWVRGRPLRKVSPTRDHSRLQTEIAAALNSWSRGQGEVGTEWRFRLEPPGERRRPLVPDVAFVTLARLRGLSHNELQSPAFGPDVAVEILSPDDDARDVAAKIDVFLRAGTALVVVVDAPSRTMRTHDLGGVTVLTAADTFRHPALPGFELRLGELFAIALDLPR